MAIYSQLPSAKKRQNGYLQSTVISQKTLNGHLQSEWLLFVLQYGKKVILLFIMLEVWGIIFSDILAYSAFDVLHF